MKKIIGLIIIISVLLFIAFLGFSNAISLWQEAQASINWPSVDGYIANSKVDVTIGNRSNRYELNIEYVYNISDITHKSNNIMIGSVPWKKNEVYAIYDKYQTDKKIKVYYDPNDPNNAVLEPRGPLRAAYNGLIIGTVSLLSAITTMVKLAWELSTSDDKAAIETNPP